MCVVSVLFQYGQERIPVDQWTPESWEAFTALVKQGDKFDRATDQPDCADPGKLAWAQQINERIGDLSYRNRFGSAADPRWMEREVLRHRLAELERQLGV